MISTESALGVAPNGAGHSSRCNAGAGPEGAESRAAAPTGRRGIGDMAGSSPLSCLSVDAPEAGKGCTALLAGSTADGSTSRRLVHLYNDDNGIRQTALHDDAWRTFHLQVKDNFP